MKNINKDKKGFTIIELIAVLVILAILALIVTPLVLNIVKSAKDSANKRSVDAYGKAIDLAVATYLLDNGDFPTSIDDLKIEYSGTEVVCGVAQLNEDSSVYLSECTVGGKEVKDSNTEDGWYHYGKLDKVVYQTYSIGDKVTYNGMNFYVIADSDEASDSVTMLKAEPLKTSEVDLSGTEVAIKVAETTNNYTDGYIHSDYLYSDTCTSIGNDTSGCTTDYKLSSIKQVVDAWAADRLKSVDLKEDATGYKVRLITIDELTTSLGYDFAITSMGNPIPNDNVPSWVYNNKFTYWTMSSYNDSDTSVWCVNSVGHFSSEGFSDRGSSSGFYVIRPVITIKKSSIS